jgi:hypothetical protein
VASSVRRDRGYGSFRTGQRHKACLPQAGRCYMIGFSLLQVPLSLRISFCDACTIASLLFPCPIYRDSTLRSAIP